MLVRLKNVLKWIIFLITDLFVRFTGRPIRKDTILLIGPDGIGDFILWLDAAEKLRSLYPPDNYRVTLLANEIWADVAGQIPNWDEIWPLNQKKFLRNPVYRYRILKKIRDAGFETTIQPAYSRRFFVEDAIIKACNSEERIGFSGDNSKIESWQKHISDRWYTRLIPATAEPLMELKRNAEFVQGLGIREVGANLPNLHIQDDNYHETAERFYVIFIGAGSKKKMWPIEKFARLAGRIYEQTGWCGIVCGGPREATVGRRLAGICSAPLKSAAGETNLSRLATLIKKAQFMVSNDTGSVHIAAAVGTPVICILGGGHYGRFLPYQVEKTTIRPLPITVSHKMDCFGCNWKCVYAKEAKDAAMPCVARISVSQVWEEIKKILQVPSLIQL